MKTKTQLLLLASTFLGLFAKADTAQVWQRHIDAWSHRDVAAIVADYSENAVVLVDHRRFNGRTEIAALFRELFATFDRAQNHVIDPAVIVGKVVYLKWHARIDGREYPSGTDTFVIENDQITYQTITFGT